MKEGEKNPAIEWKRIGNKDFLRFKFTGILTYNEALSAIEEWKKLFALKKDEKVPIIWHCLEMKDYEPMARNVWQQTLKELGRQIDIIWLVNKTAIIYAGANLISMFTSFTIKVVKTEEEVG